MTESTTAARLIDELRDEERQAILSVLDDLIAFNPGSQEERGYIRGVLDAIDAVRSRNAHT